MVEPAADTPEAAGADGSRAATTTRAVWAATAFTTSATLLVGLRHIGRSFNYDEAVTYAMFVNGGSPWRALTTQLVFNNHQLFSAVQALAWRIGLVGETPQRFLPVACGAATVGVLTWWIGRRTDAIAGFVAGAFLLCHPVYLAEFRTLRGYALATLAVLVAAIATERSWRDERGRWLWLAAVSMVVAVTSHAYSVVPLAVLAIVTLVLGHVRAAHLAAWVLAGLTAVVIQLPLLDDARRTSEARGSRYLPGFGRRLVEVYLGDHLVAIVLTAALVAVGAWSLGRRSNRHAVAVAASVAFPVVVALSLWQLVRPYDLYLRFFVTVTPFVAALVALGVHGLPRRVGLPAVAVVLAILAADVPNVTGVLPKIRDAAAVVDRARAEGLEVCGSDTIPLSVYTEPVRAVDPTVLDGPAGYGDCELFVAVAPLRGEARRSADERFAHRTDLGAGVVVYRDP